MLHSQATVDPEVIIPQLEEALLSYVEVYYLVNLLVVIIVHPLAITLAVILQLKLNIQQRSTLLRSEILSVSTEVGFFHEE